MKALTASRRIACRAPQLFARRTCIPSTRPRIQVSAMATTREELKALSTAKLGKLRELMKQANGGAGVSAYIVPTEDPHMSEQPSPFLERRAFISGFSGSAGTAVVTTDAAALWTDGRYFLQAEQELSSDWTLMKSGLPGTPEINDWILENVPEGGSVGIDPFCHTIDDARRLQKTFEAKGRKLVPLTAEGNLVDSVWGAERPAPSSAPLRVHPLKWAGSSVEDKVKLVRESMTNAGANVFLAALLDEVAWLLNLRGSDTPCYQLFLSYAMVTPDAVNLYVDKVKVTEEVAAYLASSGVTVKPYEAILDDVKAAAASGSALMVDPSKVSYAVLSTAQSAADGQSMDVDSGSAAPPKFKLVEQGSPIVQAKGVKNEAELAGMVEAHLRDAAAMSEFLSWLEKHLYSGGTITEVQVHEELTARRAKQEGFLEPSFPSIAGVGSNGAVIHYRAKEGTCKTVDKDSLLLLDSGGHYDCGTTDITRTMHFGKPTRHQQVTYTRVLQGHIALDLAVFPEGTPGCALDVLARTALWKEGLNYLHGTGHGVGAALMVHEGPQGISPRFGNTTPLRAGMIVSNEPGYYEDGAFGIRIENLVQVVEKRTNFNFRAMSFYGFEPITWVPIQTKLMALELLSPTEVAWINNYHANVWEKISPRVSGEVLEWLKTNTQPVSVPVLEPATVAA